MTSEMKPTFNLVEEPWIPVADNGFVSLERIFSDGSLRRLGGNAVQKLALLKLLLAIVQAAWTPKNDEDWLAVGAEGMAQRAFEYLRVHREQFWLLGGPRPFLQIPAIEPAALQSAGAVIPEVASGNTTVLFETNNEYPLVEREKALLLVCLMGFALGGKKTDNSIVLTAGYRQKSNDKGKASTGKPGPGVGYLGYLHSVLLADSLQKTLWLNVFTQKNIADSGRFPEGLGMAPWECMPQGEQCAVAQKLVKSFMGRLIPLCRFVLFKEEGLHYTEGIAHPSHKEGVVDSTITVDFSKKDAKALWVDTAKKPWRQLPALLSFLDVEAKSTFDCLQLRVGVPRAKEAVESFAIWTGGLKVSSNAGEQYTTGTDDYVESEISFETAMFGETWFVLFKAEMAALEMVADTLRKSVKRYYSLLKADGAKAADKAVALFWQMCERHLQLLVEACGDKQGDSLTPLKNRLHGYSYKVFDTACPRESARQLDAWAGARPSPEKF